MPVEPADFKNAASMFATGVTIVTTVDDEEMYGIAVSAFCSLSIDPMEVLVSIAKSSTLHDMIERSGFFGVSILRREQQPVSEFFSQSGRPTVREGFPGIEHVTYETGAPIMKDCASYYDCRLARALDGGDHTIYVGAVAAAGADRDAMPLLYFKGGYRSIVMD
jgi:flavin reductase (DIM6/NTAB) family NADH-FMN oxidoreductase RutF